MHCIRMAAVVLVPFGRWQRLFSAVAQSAHDERKHLLEQRVPCQILLAQLLDGLSTGLHRLRARTHWWG